MLHRVRPDYLCLVMPVAAGLSAAAAVEPRQHLVVADQHLGLQPGAPAWGRCHLR